MSGSVIITGGNQGLGLATAKAIRRARPDLRGCLKRPDSRQILSSMLTSASGELA